MKNHLPAENIQMMNTFKDTQQFLTVREMQNKTTVKCHYIPTRMAEIKISSNTKCWWGYREAHSYLPTHKMVHKSVKQFGSFWKHYHFTTITFSICIPANLSQPNENCSPKNLHTNIYSSIICNCWKLETT